MAPATRTRHTAMPLFITPIPLIKGEPLLLPLLLTLVEAGFPSPADDYVEGPLDLNDLIIRNPPATFMMRVQGRSMEGAGIFDGDLVVVDRSIKPKAGAVVIANVDGELTVKQLGRVKGRAALLPRTRDNVVFEPILLHSGVTLEVWGVVTFVVRRLKG